MGIRRISHAHQKALQCPLESTETGIRRLGFRSMVAPTALYCTGAALRKERTAASASPGRGKNIVGYAQSTLKRGVTLVTAQFGSVAADEYKLEGLTPTGPDVIDNVYIDRFDEYGAPIHTYYWTDFGDGPCWSEDLETKAENVTFAPGEAFSVTAGSEAQGLQSSGSVPRMDIAFQLRSGVSLCGNPFPVRLPIGNILPSGNEVIDNVYIDTFNEFGAPINTYYWTNLDEGPNWSADLETKAEDVTFDPGEGLSITGASEDQIITFSVLEF